MNEGCVLNWIKVACLNWIKFIVFTGTKGVVYAKSNLNTNCFISPVRIFKLMIFLKTKIKVFEIYFRNWMKYVL